MFNARPASRSITAGTSSCSDRRRWASRISPWVLISGALLRRRGNDRKPQPEALAEGWLGAKLELYTMLMALHQILWRGDLKLFKGGVVNED